MTYNSLGIHKTKYAAYLQCKQWEWNISSSESGRYESVSLNTTSCRQSTMKSVIKPSEQKKTFHNSEDATEKNIFNITFCKLFSCL